MTVLEEQKITPTEEYSGQSTHIHVKIGEFTSEFKFLKKSILNVSSKNLQSVDYETFI